MIVANVFVDGHAHSSLEADELGNIVVVENSIVVVVVMAVGIVVGMAVGGLLQRHGQNGRNRSRQRHTYQVDGHLVVAAD
jgi:hypothetical protein